MFFLKDIILLREKKIVRTSEVDRVEDNSRENDLLTRAIESPRTLSQEGTTDLEIRRAEEDLVLTTTTTTEGSTTTVATTTMWCMLLRGLNEARVILI